MALGLAGALLFDAGVTVCRVLADFLGTTGKWIAGQSWEALPTRDITLSSIF
jgi:hypothetical protein